MEMCIAVSSGKCSLDLYLKNPGKLVNSRWLTLANRILQLYVATDYPTNNLQILVTYVVKVYAPVRFNIKLKPSCTNGSKHLEAYFSYSRYLTTDLKEIIDPEIQRNGCFAAAENILLSMLCDEHKHTRELGLWRLLKARTENRDSIRKFAIPKVNFDAKDYIDFITWNNIEITETPMTRHISIDSLDQFIRESSETKTVVENLLIDFPKFPCHIQAVERMVELVTESSLSVCGSSAREAPCSVPSIEHGRVTNYAPDAIVPHDKHITVDCIAQYELRYNTTPATCNNGSWTHIPTCIPARCKTLPRRPRHGMVIAPKTDHGMKALFRCKDGYKLIGPNVTECSFGRWSGETPICNETYCPFPGVLENGRILLVGHMGMYDYRPYVRKITNNRQIMYECERHYTLSEGPPGATCVDGRWSPQEKPKCVRGSHPQVRWDRKKREAVIRRLDMRRAKRKKRGKRKHKGFCKPVETTPWMDVTVLKKGWMSSSLASRGTVIQVTCGWGYSLNIGNRTAKCVAGRWKPRKPECITTPCHIPSTSHGMYHHFDKEVDVDSLLEHSEVVTLSCDDGFQLLGPEALRCWYGEWAVNKMPKCLPGPCELRDIANGSYLDGYRAGLTISHGSSVRYTCDTDFAKAVPDPVQCLEQKLRPDVPKCMPVASKIKESNSIPLEAMMSRTGYPPSETAAAAPAMNLCTLPERLHNTLLYRGSTFIEPKNSVMAKAAIRREKLSSGGSNRYFPNGTEVLFKCLSAYSGKKTTWKIVCQDGVWVGRPHNCDTRIHPGPVDHNRNKSCLFQRPNPDVVAFVNDKKVKVDSAKFPAGTEVVYRCVDIGKYSFEGSSRRRCVGGQWTGTEPLCLGLSQEYDYARWTSEPGRDSQLEYRLTIYHAKTEDSGMFTCVTPMGHQHAVEIVVSGNDTLRFVVKRAPLISNHAGRL
ncbi:Protein lev-9 [Araneus ventricosus]|uniref:Protein lev-9 n=1 Tax=Araneus ventricosus TaxID=182803 RepID=A0A4Y2CH24_ARAVE|nr:Protein lev-9 [Araneus ventricosus]